MKNCYLLIDCTTWFFHTSKFKIHFSLIINHYYFLFCMRLNDRDHRLVHDIQLSKVKNIADTKRLYRDLLDLRIFMIWNLKKTKPEPGFI